MAIPRKPAWVYAAMPGAVVLVVGLLFCLGTSIIALAAAVVSLLRELDLFVLLGALLLVGLAAVSVISILKLCNVHDRLTSDSAWHNHYLDHAECPYCGYSIRDLSSRCCPECGESITRRG